MDEKAGCYNFSWAVGILSYGCLTAHPKTNLPPAVGAFELPCGEVKQLVSLQVGELFVTLKAPGDHYVRLPDSDSVSYSVIDGRVTFGLSVSIISC